MERTPENNSSNNPTAPNPTQNELDLGFNQMEPVVPKKPVKPEVSFFDKAKTVFGRKENSEIPQFNVRKEPTFGTSMSAAAPNNDVHITIPENDAAHIVTADNTTQTAGEAPQPVTTAGFTDAMKNVSQDVAATTVDTLAEEPLTVTQVTVSAEPAAQTETPDQDKAPQVELLNPDDPKYHTPHHAAPATDNVDSVQQTTEESTVEGGAKADVIDDFVSATKAKMKKPEEWQVMQKLPPKHRRLLIALCGLLIVLSIFFWLKPKTPTTVEDFQAQNNNALPIEFRPLAQDQQPSENVDDLAAAENGEILPTTSTSFTQIFTFAGDLAAAAGETAQTSMPEAIEPNEPEQPKTADNAGVVRQTAQSVPEKNRSAAQRIKEMERKAASTQENTQWTPKAQNNRRERQRTAPVAEVRPTRNTQVNDDNTAESIATGTAKTLTVPAGVSLMQVFRDHNLNIADVNAMTKAAGSGNVLSNFKPGDKIQVVVNAQGRVTVLRLSNGATFTRQTNGTYKYHR